VSHATTLKTRRAATARTSAAQGVGFVLGPAVGTLLALKPFKLDLGPPPSTFVLLIFFFFFDQVCPDCIVGFLHIDDFTLTGWFSAIVNISNIFVVYWLFVEVPHEEEDPTKKKVCMETQLSVKVVLRTGNAVLQMALDRKELLAFTVCIFIFMVIIANFAVFETILTVYTELYFNWVR
jgi:hypothetical protein